MDSTEREVLKRKLQAAAAARFETEVVGAVERRGGNRDGLPRDAEEMFLMGFATGAQWAMERVDDLLDLSDVDAAGA